MWFYRCGQSSASPQVPLFQTACGRLESVSLVACVLISGGSIDLKEMKIAMTTVYKIISDVEWAKACADGQFVGAEIDLADGYIHFSTALQVRETAAKHFSKRTDLLLLSVDSAQFGDTMKWEASRGGDLFPHLYSILAVSAVGNVDPLPLDEFGVHVFPKHVSD